MNDCKKSKSKVMQNKIFENEGLTVKTPGLTYSD
jgi:hypothetical protein